MEILLNRGAGVDMQDFYGVTPLMYAAANQTTLHAYIPVELLLQQEAAVNLRSRGGTTALMFAAEGGHLRCVYRLLKAGADADARNDYGQTAYQIALWRPDSKFHIKIAELLRRHMT